MMKDVPFMDVGFSMRHPKLGCIIAGGAGTMESWSAGKIPNLTGKAIIVRTEQGDLSFQVLQMSLSTSISGMITASIRLEDSIHFSRIKTGDYVYAPQVSSDDPGLQRKA